MSHVLRLELANFAYLISALLFIWALKSMAHPRTAVRGNVLGAIGMGLAILTAIVDPHVVDLPSPERCRRGGRRSGCRGAQAIRPPFPAARAADRSW